MTTTLEAPQVIVSEIATVETPKLITNLDQVDKATLSRIAKRDELLFPVEKLSIEERFGINSISGKTHCVITNRGTEKERLVNVCSEGYNLKSLKEVLMPVENELSKYFEFSANYVSTEDCRFFIDYTLKPQFKVGTNRYDNMHPQVRLVHSYSGDLRYHLEFRFLRQVCSNGLHAYVGSGAGKRKHTSGLEDAMDENIHHMNEFIQEAEKYVKKYEVLYDSPVEKLEDRIMQVIEATAFPKTYADVVAERARFETLAFGIASTDWLVYNAFNYQLNHNENLKMQPQNRSKVDLEVLEFLMKN